MERLRSFHNNPNNNGNKNNNWPWIESLADDILLSDYRKYCIWRIFVPYYINVKKMSETDTIKTVKAWLDRCNISKPLDFDPVQKIEEAISNVESYLPIAFDNGEKRTDLKREHPQLYNKIVQKGF